MDRTTLIKYLRERGTYHDHSHDAQEVYVRHSHRQTIPRLPKIPNTLAQKICRSLDLPLPPSLRYQPPAFQGREFSIVEAEEILRKSGYSIIRWEKFKYTEQGVWHEDWTQLTPEKAKKKSVRKPYFWVPCAYDGDRGWQYEAVAPHWLKTKKERLAFVTKHWRETEWHCERGEVSEDSIRFLNTQLGTLRSSSDFKGSPNIPESSKEHAREVISDLGVIGSRYLAKAISKGLSLTEPDHRHISEEKLMSGQGMTKYVGKTIPEIIELAFRAGRTAERLDNYYRGGPFVAQQGFASVEQQGKGRRPRKAKDLENWERTVLFVVKKESPEATNPEVLDALIENKVIESLSDGRLRWQNENKTVSRQSAIQRISRLRAKKL